MEMTKEELSIKDRFKRILETPITTKDDRKKSVETYKLFFQKVVEQGISRIAYYAILQELVEYYSKNNREDLIDELYDIEASIIGHCSSSLIPRFKNEPLGKEEFVGYVRALKWKIN